MLIRQEVHMPARLSWFLLLTLLVAPAVHAKDKNKASFPQFVLRARTALVVVSSDAGEPLDHPTRTQPLDALPCVLGCQLRDLCG
jgi:hypothetical protein